MDSSKVQPPKVNHEEPKKSKEEPEVELIREADEDDPVPVLVNVGKRPSTDDPQNGKVTVRTDDETPSTEDDFPWALTEPPLPRAEDVTPRQDVSFQVDPENQNRKPRAAERHATPTLGPAQSPTMQGPPDAAVQHHHVVAPQPRPPTPTTRSIEMDSSKVQPPKVNHEEPKKSKEEPEVELIREADEDDPVPVQVNVRKRRVDGDPSAKGRTGMVAVRRVTMETEPPDDDHLVLIDELPQPRAEDATPRQDVSFKVEPGNQNRKPRAAERPATPTLGPMMPHTQGAQALDQKVRTDERDPPNLHYVVVPPQRPPATTHSMESKEEPPKVKEDEPPKELMIFPDDDDEPDDDEPVVRKLVVTPPEGNRQNAKARQPIAVKAPPQHTHTVLDKPTINLLLWWVQQSDDGAAEVQRLMKALSPTEAKTATGTCSKDPNEYVRNWTPLKQLALHAVLWVSGLPASSGREASGREASGREASGHNLVYKLKQGGELMGNARTRFSALSVSGHSNTVFLKFAKHDSKWFDHNHLSRDNVTHFIFSRLMESREGQRWQKHWTTHYASFLTPILTDNPSQRWTDNNVLLWEPGKACSVLPRWGGMDCLQADILHGKWIPALCSVTEYLDQAIDLSHWLGSEAPEQRNARILEFLNWLAYVGRKFGFLHNDLHMGNVLYDKKRQRLVLIDYGRCHFGYVTDTDRAYFGVEKSDNTEDFRLIQDVQGFLRADLKKYGAHLDTRKTRNNTTVDTVTYSSHYTNVDFIIACKRTDALCRKTYDHNSLTCATTSQEYHMSFYNVASFAANLLMSTSYHLKMIQPLMEPSSKLLRIHSGGGVEFVALQRHNNITSYSVESPTAVAQVLIEVFNRECAKDSTTSECAKCLCEGVLCLALVIVWVLHKAKLLSTLPQKNFKVPAPTLVKLGLFATGAFQFIGKQTDAEDAMRFCIAQTSRNAELQQTRLASGLLWGPLRVPAQPRGGGSYDVVDTAAQPVTTTDCRGHLAAALANLSLQPPTQVQQQAE
jgi:hypothetical protein